MDIRGYYPNMRHDVAKSVFKNKLEPEVYNRAAKILDSFPGEVGFNPGSQIIQITDISVLNNIDHYIKERLRIKHYLRNMDYMLIISNSKSELKNIQEDINIKLNQIGF